MVEDERQVSYSHKGTNGWSPGEMKHAASPPNPSSASALKSPAPSLDVEVGERT